MNGWFYAKCRKYLDPDVSEEAQIAEPNSRCPTSTRTVLPVCHHQFPDPQAAKQKCSWNRRLRRFGQKNPLSSTSVDRAFTRLIFSDFPVLFAPGRHFPLNSSPTEQSHSSKPPGGLQPHLRLFLAVWTSSARRAPPCGQLVSPPSGPCHHLLQKRPDLLGGVTLGIGIQLSTNFTN
jgi:hypothetical protein